MFLTCIYDVNFCHEMDMGVPKKITTCVNFLLVILKQSFNYTNLIVTFCESFILNPYNV